MEFRAEAYNVFNTSNFTTMDTKARFTIDTTNGNTLTQTSSTYGHFTAAHPKRRLQLALRLTF